MVKHEVAKDKDGKFFIKPKISKDKKGNLIIGLPTLGELDQANTELNK